ncbi:MAG TPA: sensor histidine kinase [Polyangia bacterium]|nr:sensor histidine kinase [Polyangia bacterium]
MRLTEFIQENHKKIVAEWVAFARTLTPWATGLNDDELRDHAAELLTAVVSDMRSSQTKTEQSDKSKGLAPDSTLGRVGHQHANERLDTGLKIGQLVSEYRALRASVLRLWAEAQGDKQGELTRFNEAIDETLAESANRYSDIVNNTREQFLAILGHDLRNPLAAIILGAAALSKSESLDDKESRVAARIFNSGERMNRMVNDLLDLTRTRLGAGIPVTPKAMDLSPICRQVISELEAVHPDCKVGFETKGDLHGEWDSDRLTQVISNLVANAVQYGCEHGPVSVFAEAQGDEVVLRVHNAGPPIPENAVKQIFDAMIRQPTQSREKNATGLGLGLYIARQVVAAHGGTVDVRSTKEEGTTFTVKLPRHPAPPESNGARSSRAE